MSFLDIFANPIRDAILTPRETARRQEAKDHVKLGKLISLVTFVTTLFFATITSLFIFPAALSLFTLPVLGVIALASNDMYQGSKNLLEIFDSATIEASVRSSRDLYVKHLSQGMSPFGEYMVEKGVPTT